MLYRVSTCEMVRRSYLIEADSEDDAREIVEFSEQVDMGSGEIHLDGQRWAAKLDDSNWEVENVEPAN